MLSIISFRPERKAKAIFARLKLAMVTHFPVVSIYHIISSWHFALSSVTI